MDAGAADGRLDTGRRPSRYGHALVAIFGLIVPIVSSK